MNDFLRGYISAPNVRSKMCATAFCTQFCHSAGKPTISGNVIVDNMSALGVASTRPPEMLQLLLSAGANPNAIAFKHGENTYSSLDLAVADGNFNNVQILLKAGAKTTTLAMAARTGAWEIVRLLLEKGADPNSAFQLSRCMDISSTNDIGIETLRVVLEYGADPNLREMATSGSLLQCACDEGRKDVAELLIEHGADVNASPALICGATALQYAALHGHLEIADLLIKKEANVNAAPAEMDGRTALEGAAEYGRLDMIKLLINASADLSIENGQYERALERALKNGHMAVRKLLICSLS